MSFSVPTLIFLGIVAVLLFSMVRILQEYERGVVFRLGRYVRVMDAGLNFLLPFGIERSEGGATAPS